MSTSSDSRTRTILMTGAAVLTCALFWPAFKFAWEKWGTDPNYGHGYFIPVASGYLLWRMRAAIRARGWKPSAMGFAFILPALVLHVMAANAGLYRFSMVAFVAVVAGVIVVFFGWGMLKQVSFPLAFLLFAVPIPLFLESITLPMKLMVAQASAWLLSILGYQVFREGLIVNVIVPPPTSLGVWHGLRFLVLISTLGALYAYVTQRTKLRRWIAFLLFIPIAIVANVGLLVATVILARLTSTRAAYAFYHNSAGVFVFVVAGILFVVAGIAINAVAGSRPTEKTAHKNPPTEEMGAVADRSNAEKKKGGKANYYVLIAILAAGIATVVCPCVPPLRIELGDLPLRIGDWVAEGDNALPEEVLRTLGATEFLQREYRCEGEELVLLVTYLHTGHGTPTHKPKKWYTAQGWTFLDKKTVKVPGTDCLVMQSIVVKGDERKILLYWYQLGSTVLVDKWRLCACHLLRATLKRPTKGLVVVMQKDIPGDGDPLFTKAEMAFARQVMEELAKIIPAGKDDEAP